jgi:dihydropteroate synthase
MTELRWGEKTYLMGIINVTPDSFSGDGIALAGRSTDEVLVTALAQARAFVEAGADILDVGAESTRPASVYGEHAEVDAATEIGLAVPVIAALAAGARMVNDVWAARRDPDTAAAAAEADAYLVLMHNKERALYEHGVFDEVVAWLTDAIDAAIAAGVRRDRLLVDPGIGFGKKPEHSIELLHRLAELKDALGGLPMLVGTSRKRFIGEILGGLPPAERLEGTAATVALAVGQGVDVVRVHDVAHMARTVRVADAIVRLRR